MHREEHRDHKGRTMLAPSMCLARKTVLDLADRKANKYCGQGKVSTSAMLITFIYNDVENEVVRYSEIRISFVCDARVLAEGWQVFTRYGGQQRDTWH